MLDETPKTVEVKTNTPTIVTFTNKKLTALQIKKVDEKSGERALWELVQNARDMSSEARIKIELTENSIIFSHHGEPFDYTSFRALVKQDSSKDRNGAE